MLIDAALSATRRRKKSQLAAPLLQEVAPLASTCTSFIWFKGGTPRLGPSASIRIPLHLSTGMLSPALPSGLGHAASRCRPPSEGGNSPPPRSQGPGQPRCQPSSSKSSIDRYEKARDRFLICLKNADCRSSGLVVSGFFEKGSAYSCSD